jgi:septum formation protein
LHHLYETYKTLYNNEVEPIILASGSPRRADYFRLLGLPFTCMAPQVNEDIGPLHVRESALPAGERASSVPCDAAAELAIRKVQKIVENLKSESPSTPSPTKSPLWVCGADTLIALDGKIYGKPASRPDAAFMLRSFSGRTHEVISAVALYSGRTGKTDCRRAVSAVTFAPLSEGEIEWYLDSGEWRDAAGAYKIQGLASCFITGISGSYSCIVGLPLREFYVMLRDNGYPYGG